MVLFYLMSKQGFSLRAALSHVMGQRASNPSAPYTHPNQGFMRELMKQEEALRGQRSLTIDEYFSRYSTGRNLPHESSLVLAVDASHAGFVAHGGVAITPTTMPHQAADIPCDLKPCAHCGHQPCGAYHYSDLSDLGGWQIACVGLLFPCHQCSRGRSKGRAIDTRDLRCCKCFVRPGACDCRECSA